MSAIDPSPLSPDDHWSGWLWRFRWGIAAALLLVTAAAAPALRGVRLDNSLEVWVEHDSDAYRGYQEFLDRFGSEEYILLVYTPPEPLDLDFLFQLTDLRLDLLEIEGVREVECLSRVYGRFFGNFSGAGGIEAFRQDVAVSPFYRGFLIAEDGDSAAVWVQIDLPDPEERRRIVEAVEAIVATDPLGRGLALAGSPVINVALDRASRRGARLLFPFVFLVSGLLLWILYRRLRPVLIPFLTVGVGITWTVVLLTVTGHSLNLVTVALPPIVWVLGLATSIHLLSRCQALLGEGVALAAAVRGTLAEVARPCAFSALTTALGFASLLVADLPPVRQMGMFAAFGVLACLLAGFLLFPALASLLLREGPRAGAPATTPPRFERRLARLACRRPGSILLVCIVLVMGLGAGLIKLRPESNVLKFFKQDAPITVTYERLMAGFTGPYSLEVLLRPPEGITLESLRRLEGVVAAIADRPEVARVLSPLDLIKKGYQQGEALPPEVFELPPDDARLQGVRRTLEEQSSQEWRQLVAPDGTLRLSVLARVMGSQEHARLKEALEEELVGIQTWQPRLTGIVNILVDLQRRLLRSQIESFALAFLVIGLVMALLLRSVRHALVSLPPNLLPALFALGMMGILDIPLDPATIMIAGVALGVAVDDTIHLMVVYRWLRRQGASREAAVTTTLERVGRPIALTSAVAGGGFLVLCLAEFVPLIHFGILTGVTLGAAFLADLLLLPALLVGLPRLWPWSPPLE